MANTALRLIINWKLLGRPRKSWKDKQMRLLMLHPNYARSRNKLCERCKIDYLWHHLWDKHRNKHYTWKGWKNVSGFIKIIYALKTYKNKSICLKIICISKRSWKAAPKVLSVKNFTRITIKWWKIENRKRKSLKWNMKTHIHSLQR